jgi:hypothetical protein
MMKKSVTLYTILILLCAVNSASQARRQVAAKSNEIGPKAIWNPPQEVWGRMQEVCSSGGVECVASFMRRAGASPQAIAFTRLLKDEGYMTSFSEMGKVDLVSVFYPFRANTNDAILLVNGTPQVIDLEDLDKLGKIDIRRDPLYPSLARRFPEIELWGNPQFETSQRIPTGGQRIIIKYVLLNGCHACEIAGYAHIAFDFDSTGTFRGLRLLRLSRPEPARR